MKISLSQNAANISTNIKRLFSGVVLCLVIAAFSIWAHSFNTLKTFSPAIIAVICGILIGNVFKLPTHTHHGTAFSGKILVRIAVAFLGIQISFAELAQFGLKNLAITISTLFASFFFIKMIGKRLGVHEKLAELIAAGTSVCGAAAVMGVNTATDAEDDDVTYAIGMVTIFGTIAMLSYPFIGNLLQLSDNAFGMWCGISIHEVAQVVGAVSSAPPTAVHTATITKLTRVLMLVPLVLMLGLKNSEKTSKAPKVPFFVIGFILLLIIGNILPISHNVKELFAKASGFLLTVALAGMGLNTKLSAISAKGFKPFVLSLIGAIFISTLGLGLIEILE